MCYYTIKDYLQNSDDEILFNVFMNKYIPDIIIGKREKRNNKPGNGNNEYDPFIILDAKNSDLENQSSDLRRSRTH